MKRAVIIHGFEAKAEEGFRPWLKQGLEKNGFHVLLPQMPNANQPKIKEWVNFLNELIPNPDPETFLIGHSLGGITIRRYLKQLPLQSVIGGAVFIAGFAEPLTDDRQDKRQNFFKQPLDWNKVNQHCPVITAIFSDNDWAVPPENIEPFKQRPNTQVIVLSKRGHFSTEDNCTELPEALAAVLKLAKE